jgi:hypothetical protein
MSRHNPNIVRFRHSAIVLYGLATIAIFALLFVLLGCGDVYKSTAKLVGCDPKAVDMGYCTMPKTLPQGAQR